MIMSSILLRIFREQLAVCFSNDALKCTKQENSTISHNITDIRKTQLLKKQINPTSSHCFLT